MTERSTVVLDFDGTLALGRGPLLAYIDALAAEPGGERAGRACRDAVAEFEAGGSPHRDAYDAVRTGALAHGLTRAELGRAYLASRELLGTPAAPVSAPEGLAPFLTELTTLAHCVLATNAPPTGVERALRALGIDAVLTERHHDVGKPAGLSPIISRHLTHGSVLAVGDIWEFDLAPAAELGANTALVGVREVPAARPTLRGETLTDLYDPIRAWVNAQHPASSA